MKGYPNLYFSLFVAPMICEPLVGQPISECIKGNRHLASLELADIAEGTSALAVDILIGSDYYWELVTGGYARERVVLWEFTQSWDGYCLGRSN